MISLSITDLGRISYQQCWDIQKLTQKKLIDNKVSEAIFFCEHPPCFTYGGSTDLKEVLKLPVGSPGLEGYELIKTDRGGNITFHGPGQLVCYLILNLALRKPDVNWYLRTLEDCIVELLSGLEVEAFCIPSKTGIWTSSVDKICSIGVRFSRWCSMHGLSLNLSEQSENGFKLIYPCGINDAQATSVESVVGLAPDRLEVLEKLTGLLLKKFYSDFQLDYVLQ